MLTPFDIQDRVVEIHRLAAYGGLIADMRARSELNKLYMDVLREIAKGSPDPKSLANEVLKTSLEDL